MKRWDYFSEVTDKAPCPVCGFERVVKGYDCIACYVVGELSDEDLKVFSPMKFAASLIKAMGRRKAT